MNKNYILLIFPIFLIASCGATMKREAGLKQEIQHAYRNICIVHQGLNYPYDEADLLDCITSEDKACLKAFNSVMDARQFLLEQIQTDPELVLNITLETIFSFAASMSRPESRLQTPNERLVEQTTCSGAVIAIYFFDTESQDEIILNRLKNAPSYVLDWLFAMEYEWRNNRPHPLRWIKFVETLPGETFPNHRKRKIIDSFSITSSEKRGIMLERP